MQKGAITTCERSPGDFVSQIFARPKKNSEKLILNLKQLNKFILYKHFKMEHFSLIINLVNKDDYFVSIDLTDAYFFHPNS